MSSKFERLARKRLRRLFARLKILGFCAIGAYVAASRSCAYATEPLRRVEIPTIVNNIRANEDLYRNFEVRLAANYRLLKRGEDLPGLHSLRECDFRAVHQDGFVYLDSKEMTRQVDGTSGDESVLLGFDGKMTRVVGQRAVANIHEGFYHDVRDVPPHAIALQRAFVVFPLSEYVAGGRHAPYFSNESFYLGRDTVDGLDCIKLRIEAWTSSRADYDYSLLWLASDRNFFPVKKLSFATGYSKEFPLGETHVSDFREIAPGIWFPFKISVIVHDELALRRGESLPGNEENYIVSEARLDPNYDISLFRDIKIPDGIPVHEIKDGKIINSYIQGGAPMEQSKASSVPTVMFLNIAIIVAAALYVYFARRKSQRRLALKQA